MDKESLHKEIDLIQACITRMANNSFLLKGWTVTLCAVILALADKDVGWHIGLLVLVPLFCFWYLDGFFLHTEKKYQALYQWVLTERAKNNLSHQYDLDTDRFNAKVKSAFRLMLSRSLLWFYLVPAILATVVGVSKFMAREHVAASVDAPSRFIEFPTRIDKRP